MALNPVFMGAEYNGFTLAEAIGAAEAGPAAAAAEEPTAAPIATAATPAATAAPTTPAITAMLFTAADEEFSVRRRSRPPPSPFSLGERVVVAEPSAFVPADVFEVFEPLPFLDEPFPFPVVFEFPLVVFEFPLM